MDWHTHIIENGKIFGLTAYEFFWTAMGVLANAVFTCRFLVQWYATEKRKQVTIPVMFWWFSLLGSIMLLSYAVFYDRHKVIIWAYAFPWIPYTRNLIIYYRHKNAEKTCLGCGERSSPHANYCATCGTKLMAVQP